MRPDALRLVALRPTGLLPPAGTGPRKRSANECLTKVQEKMCILRRTMDHCRGADALIFTPSLPLPSLQNVVPTWPTGAALALASSAPRGRHANARLCDCHITVIMAVATSQTRGPRTKSPGASRLPEYESGPLPQRITETRWTATMRPDGPRGYSGDKPEVTKVVR